MTIRVAHVGLGPIGTAVLQTVVERPGLKVVAAVDVDPALVGRDLGELAGLRTASGIKVSAALSAELARTAPDVVVLCTSSSIATVLPQVRTILRAGAAIVSTTEELAYPWRTHRREAGQIDRWAKKAGAAVVGTGVNPGYAMDALPIALTAVCTRVDRVSVERVQDARIRRLPFQQEKIGAGLTAVEFRRRVKAGSVRHVGLTESIAMIGDALGWTIDRITDRIIPKIAEAAISSEFLSVEAGQVCGIVQDGIGYRGRVAAIRLHMEAYLGAPESYDAVRIDGVPPLDVKVAGGIHGDVATVAMVVNAIPAVLGAPPGLHTMRDLPLPSFFPG